MARSDMYRKLPWTGGDARSVAEIVNNLVEGKSNNTGTITLVASGAVSTTINDERIGYNSYIGLEPLSQTAASTYFPYGAFQDTTDQSIATTTATANITLNTTDYSLGTSLVASLNYYIELAKNDYVHLAWATNSVQVTLEQLPTQTSPTRPATPSAIITLQYLSANSFTTNLFTEPYISSQSQGTATISHPANTGTNKVYRYIIVG